MVGVSCKCHDMIREQQATRVVEGLQNGDIESGSGLNQELSLKRPGATCWGSYCKSLLNVVVLFPHVVDVVEYISIEGEITRQTVQAKHILALVRTFDFVFSVHLMIEVLGITNDLSLALQKKYHNITNAIRLVEVCKRRLRCMRDIDQSELLLNKVRAF